MTRILCLWLPNWAIQRTIRCRPELRARPVALVATGVRGKISRTMIGQASNGAPSIVATCCGKAVAQGVRPGMPLAEAQALVRNLGVAVYDAQADRAALAKLAEACERFSPRVAVEEGEEPESLLLDISNLEHLYRSEAKLLTQVENFFTRRGYRVQLAVGETVGAAWATAHFSDKRAGASPTPRDDCGLRIGDCGLKTFNRKSEIRNPQLPVEALRVADDTAALLHQLGIESVDQLLALPRAELASRFGEELLLRLDQLSGSARELIEPHRGLPPLVASYALEEPTGDRAVLMHVLKQLVDELARQLATRDEGAVLLMCLLHLAGGKYLPAPSPRRGGLGRGEQRTEPFSSSSQVLRIGLLQPSANPRQLLELIELHLENVRLADEVDKVELRATVVGRLGERQRELFADRWTRDPQQLALLVNRLSSRLGSDRVLAAELRKSPAPERCVKWRLAVEKKDRATRRQGDREKGRKSNSPCLPFSLSLCLPPRPLTLYRTPQAMEVVCVAPDGPPQFVWFARHREKIVSCLGPERIETLWWRGSSVRRDYYRVATNSGSHLWMFRQLHDGKWFVHGEFA